ncbi:MAG: hypothetical protein QXM68_04140, partial [Candidatus Aenigmatarchaeota archaeon]
MKLFVILLLLSFSVVHAQQSHPLSQITPIDANLNMNSNSIINANWMNATNMNANTICLSNSCQSSWPSNSGWAMSSNAVYNNTANVRVGIGTSTPVKNLDVVGDANTTGNLYANQLIINNGFPSALTIDSAGNILTKGNLTYSGYTYIIDTLRYNGSLEAPYEIKGGYIYPGTCNTGVACLQSSYYLYTSGSTITANTNLAASALYDNGNRVLTSVSAGSGLASSGSAPSITLSLAYNDNLLGWTNLTGYPSACPGGQFVSAIGDTLTCGTPSGSSSGWTMSSSYLYNNTAGVRVGIGLTNPSTE